MRHFSITVDYLANTSILFVTDMDESKAKKYPSGAIVRPTKEYKKISTPGDVATAVKDFVMEISDGDSTV